MIEAATEDRDAKAAIFAELGRRTRAGVVLAYNTSSIRIRELGAASGRPDDVIGMHFFNPPPVMALLELTPSADTSAPGSSSSTAIAAAGRFADVVAVDRRKTF